MGDYMVVIESSKHIQYLQLFIEIGVIGVRAMPKFFESEIGVFILPSL
jgi:hypothetical protein